MHFGKLQVPLDIFIVQDHAGPQVERLCEAKPAAHSWVQNFLFDMKKFQHFGLECFWL